jgi:hypothetical protein
LSLQAADDLVSVREIEVLERCYELCGHLTHHRLNSAARESVRYAVIGHVDWLEFAGIARDETKRFGLQFPSAGERSRALAGDQDGERSGAVEPPRSRVSSGGECLVAAISSE